MTEARIPAAVFGGLRSSGFPFQTAIAHVIRAKAAEGWSVHASEYAWRTPDGTTQFLDLVATNRRLFLAIECKKTSKDIFTFLRPVGHGHTGDHEDFRCLRAEQVRDSTKRLELYCEEWALLPRTRASEFCVVSTSKTGGDQRLLERDAGLLVRANDAFADDFRAGFEPDLDAPPSAIHLFIPVIVTNAAIYTTRYQPTEVSLTSGEFSRPPKEIEAAPCVRFRKSFTSETRFDLGDRSVFVVQAGAFAEFLDLLDVSANQPDDRARVPFRSGPRKRD